MDIEILRNLLSSGQDNLLLRFGIAQELLKTNEHAEAIVHLQRALVMDPSHSASRKILGKAYTATGKIDEAIKNYRKGIKIAEQEGDIQAAKEMKVFLKRLIK